MPFAKNKMKNPSNHFGAWSSVLKKAGVATSSRYFEAGVEKRSDFNRRPRMWVEHSGKRSLSWCPYLTMRGTQNLNPH